LREWLENPRIKPVIWDEAGKAYYLQGRCVECAIKGEERYLYEDAARKQMCFTVRQIVSMSAK
jgi:hypothetical protein